MQQPSFFVGLAHGEHWWRHWREQQSCGFYASLVMVPTRSQNMLRVERCYPSSIRTGVFSVERGP
jgi:hypothetical protein